MDSVKNLTVSTPEFRSVGDRKALEPHKQRLMPALAYAQSSVVDCDSEGRLKHYIPPCEDAHFVDEETEASFVRRTKI